jgi:hypothetical protein
MGLCQFQLTLRNKPRTDPSGPKKDRSASLLSKCVSLSGKFHRLEGDRKASTNMEMGPSLAAPKVLNWEDARCEKCC